MPKSKDDGSARQDELPSTLQRSDKQAQDTWAQTYDAAAAEYDDSRAPRTAWATLKRTHEKVGDHWEPKGESGPSDDRSDTSDGSSSRRGETAGGVDANASKTHLQDLARRLDVTGRSTMTKDELVDAIEKANAKSTRDARGDRGSRGSPKSDG